MTYYTALKRINLWGSIRRYFGHRSYYTTFLLIQK